MVGLRQPTLFTEREYLALEAASDTKHELIGGEIWGMAGAGIPHLVVCHNLHRALAAAIGTRPCLVLGSDLRVKVDANHYFYPDVTLKCGELDLTAQKPPSLVNPDVVFEVLSESTASVDRHVKWSAYQGIASLTDYVMLATDTMQVEHYQRGPDAWLYRRLGAGDSLALSNGVALDVTALYHLVPGLEAQG